MSAVKLLKASLVNAAGCVFDELETTSIKAVKEWARGRGGKYHVSVMRGEEIITFSVRTTSKTIAAEEETVSFVAKPGDSRCSWWSVQLPAEIELNSEKIPAPYLRNGADLELKEGDMLVTSEAKHHRKNRGYDVYLSVCVGGEVKHIFPAMQRKTFIKANGGKDLMHESGDVAGCVRMAVWLRRQPSITIAFEQLLQA